MTKLSKQAINDAFEMLPAHIKEAAANRAQARIERFAKERQELYRKLYNIKAA